MLIAILIAMAQSLFSQVNSYPWSEDFESGSFDTKGWTQTVISGSESWHLRNGAHPNSEITAHSGSYNAYISNSSYNNDTTLLLSPVFSRPDFDTLVVSFWYANPQWASDFDDLIVKYIDAENSREVLTINDSHNGWTRANIIFKSSELAETFQIGFYGIPHYGYGFIIDDVSLKEHHVVIDTEETDSYRQIGTNTTIQDFLPTYNTSEYTFSEQLYSAVEMGGDKTIYSIAFKKATESIETSRYLKVYIGQTNLQNFIDRHDWTPIENMTKVFSGNVEFPETADWITIPFAQPFQYSDTSSLVVAIYDYTGNADQEEMKFECSETDEYMTLSFNYTWNINVHYISDIQGNIYDRRSNTRFGLEPIEQPPAYLQVGTGTQEQAILPTNTEYNYSYSQQIFTANEMGGARTIYSLSFNVTNLANESNRIIKVYMGHTRLAEFDYISEWVQYSDLTKVYSGSMELNAEDGWTTIILDQPFQYNGTDNLVLAIDDNTASTIEVSAFFGSKAPNGRSLYANSTNYNYYPSAMYDEGSLATFRSNVRFGLEFVEPIISVDTIETQEYLQVGTGTEDHYALPFNFNYNYSYSQQIFTANEMGGARNIYSLALFCKPNDNGDAIQRNIRIYMGHTSISEFDNTDDWITDSLKREFVGIMEIPAGGNCWVNIALSQVFAYNGTDNLFIAFDDNTGNQVFNDGKFACSASDKDMSIYKSNDWTNINPIEVEGGTIIRYRNNIRFGLEYIEPEPLVVDTLETETYLQVGTGTENYSLPTDNEHSYYYSQQIFNAYEMGGPRTIYSLAFHCEENDHFEPITRDFKIYMGHTLKEEFLDDKSWITDSLHRVYSGTVEISGTGNCWLEIVLDRPFVYNGTDNMFVAVYDNTGTFVYANSKFTSSSCIYDYSIQSYDYDITPFNASSYGGNVSNYRSNIRFGLAYIEPTPQVIDTVETAEYLQVGTQDMEEDLPVNCYYNYGLSQQIYDTTEMGGARTIYSLSFKYVGNAPGSTSRKIKLYMGEIERDEIRTPNDWVSTSELTEVYDGNFDIPESSAWIRLIMDRPFNYSGRKNLVIAIADSTGYYNEYMNFACSRTQYSKAIEWHDDWKSNYFDSLPDGNMLEFRNNIRFGLEYIAVYHVSVATSDSIMGTVTGGGRCVNNEGISVEAIPHPGFMFSEWSDGNNENPRFVRPTSDTLLIAYFTTLACDTLNYDNGTYNTVIGATHQDTIKWGISFIPQILVSRPNLTDVLFYVDGEYAFGTFELDVYQGTDTIPTESIYHDSVSVDSLTEGWISFGIDTIAINTELPLWIILSNSDAHYPAATSTFTGEGFRNGAWFNANGTWSQQAYGAWMIKAVLPIVEEDDDDDDDDFVSNISIVNISIYPNPVHDFFRIDGIGNGEKIEIYNSLGQMVMNFSYDGDVDASVLPSGVYVIKANTGIVRFVKE